MVRDASRTEISRIDCDDAEAPLIPREAFRHSINDRLLRIPSLTPVPHFHP